MGEKITDKSVCHKQYAARKEAERKAIGSGEADKKQAEIAQRSAKKEWQEEAQNDMETADGIGFVPEQRFRGDERTGSNWGAGK